jgi:threonine synthase
MNAWLGFRCTQCAHEYPRDAPADLCSKCGGVLFAAYDLAALAGRVSRREFESRPPALLERWAELMPVADRTVFGRVSLGETQTPLLEIDRLQQAVGMPRLALKMDAHLPTGSLKDRPMSAGMAAALERKMPVVAMSSSGNAAGSLAAHAARAGLRAVVGVFSGIPAAKLCKIRVHGPTVLQVAGGMDDAEDAIRSLAGRGGWFNVQSFVNPFPIEGEKTIGLELSLQSGWDPPEVAVFPLGSAGCLLGSYKAFRELRELGLISRIPRLIGVQFDACAPIATAFAEGRPRISRFARKPSFSTTLMHEEPVSGNLALRAIRETGGAALAVSDDEVRRAMGIFGETAGIFAEPAAAIAMAGVLRLKQEGRLEPDIGVVCLVSGSGLNYMDAAPQRGKLTEPMSLERIHAMAPEELLA